ncbi:MAG: alpha/beta fold hydrolase [Chloroflexi bacterium]|nr:alpha/beta fold hydrolase [Chloroflexota bacterium]MBP8059718.1 alpha/beta fold hydrolase [Chloroflexota bacterium]
MTQQLVETLQEDTQPRKQNRAEGQKATPPRKRGKTKPVPPPTEPSLTTEEALERLKREAANLRAELNKLQALREKGESLHTAQSPPEIAENAAHNAGAADGALGLGPLIGFNRADIRIGLQKIASQAVKQPLRAMQHSVGFLGEVSRVLRGKSTLAPEPKDRRFSDPAWETNRLYGVLLQTYLALQESLSAYVEGAELPPKDAVRAQFALKIVMEALAPTNSLLGNPTALKKVIDTGGESLWRGFQNFLGDMAYNGGMPSQVDMTAYEIGKNLARSSGAVVFKNEVLELIQYAPVTAEVYSRPLLMIPPQINKFYVLDLAPGKSLVEYLVKQGFTVFIISWRNPIADQRHWGLETYLRAVKEAIDASRAITGSEDVNIMAACAGGMTLATLLAHLAATKDARVHAVTMLVTVIDSKTDSMFEMFASPEMIAAAKAYSRARGVLKGSDMARVFNWMRPNDLIWNYWVNNYLLGETPPAFDVLYWNNDTTNLPAQFHSDLLDILTKNPFRNPGVLTFLGTPIYGSEIKNDTFIVAGATDHITPWRGCYATTQIFGGECEFILSTSGHIQSILNPPGNPKSSYFTNPEHPPNPDQWLEGAKKQSGSWWEHWRNWLEERSGGKQPASQSPGNEQYKPGAAAPGLYALAR